MAKRIGYMFLDNQLTLVLGGEAIDIDPGHPKYKDIIAWMQRPDGETEQQEEARELKLRELVDTDRIDLREAATAFGFDDIKIEHGVVSIKGVPVHNSLTAKIAELKKAGLPYTAFVNFMVNLAQNPSEESKESLYDFLEQGRFPLTEDGCFLGYKGVLKGRLTRPDGSVYETLVDGHSRSFDMAPGNKHSMPWDAVDDNRNAACGAGFHVGTISHAQGYGDTMIVVKVNPKDCVSVPVHDREKLRACAYEIVNIYETKGKARELIRPVYSQEEIESDSFEEEEEKEYSLLTPSGEARRAEFEAMGRDDICREAARQAIFASTNEARWLGKELVVEALVLNAIPFDKMSREQIAQLAERRHLYASVRAGLKAGKDTMIAAIQRDNDKRKKELAGETSDEDEDEDEE